MGLSKEVRKSFSDCTAYGVECESEDELVIRNSSLLEARLTAALK